MKDSYEKLLEKLEYREIPAGLSDRILLSIRKETVTRALVVRTVLSGALSFAAVAALVPSWLLTQSEVTQSGFYQFMSLLLSDTNTVMVLWKEFLISLVESFPLMGTMAVLASVFVFLISIRMFVRDIAVISHQPKLSKT